MFLLKVLLHLPISKIKSKLLGVVFNILVIWLTSVVIVIITTQTCPALQPYTSYTSSFCYILSDDKLFPLCSFHLLCLDVLPFFVLLGTPFPPNLSLGIISFLSVCFRWYIPLTWQVDVLSTASRITLNTLCESSDHIAWQLFPFPPKLSSGQEIFAFLYF